MQIPILSRFSIGFVRANDVDRRARCLMAGGAPGKLLGIMQEGSSRRPNPELHPNGAPEIAAATGYPDDEDLAQTIILPRRPSRDRSTGRAEDAILG